MNLKRLVNDTRLQVGFTLFLIWLLDVWHFRADANILRIIIYPLLSIALIAVLDVAMTWLRYRKVLGPQVESDSTRTASFAYLPTAATVSGFLIGLILAPSELIYVILIAAILASLSKQFLAKGPRQHIFNPAAFGIMGVYFLFGTTVSWWGVAWGFYPLVILIPLMVRLLWRLKRLFLPAGFLVIYGGYLLVTTSPQSALMGVIDPTILLFVLVMLPEPMTSPAVGYFKYSFGLIVAAVAILISSFAKISEIFLPALLFANLISFAYLKLKVYPKTMVR